MKKQPKKYTDEYLIQKLQEKTEQLCRAPTQKEVNEDNSMPSASVYCRRFGSYNNALKAGGLEISKKGSYTGEELLEPLRRKAEKLGKLPTKTEVNQDKSIPHSATYITRFGSWNETLRAAGLEPNESYTKEGLIEALRKKAEELGRTPTVEEIAGDKSIPSAALYFRRFGSYNNALKEAGLDINVKKGRYTDKKLIELLQNKAKELGRTPSQRGMEEDGSLPSGRTYQDRFGSWNEALDAAGLGTNRDFYTDKELLSLLKNKAEELGRTPTVREVNTDKSMPGASTYSDRFGSWNKAVKAAGLEPYNQKFEKQYSNEELLNVLKKKAKELGRTPHVSDIDADKSIASIAIYYQRFGSFKNALKEAGLERKNYNYSDEELVDILKKKHEEAGKSPTAREIDEDKSIPSSNTYISRFGSWNKALEAANIEPNYKIKPKRRSLTEKLLEERL